MKKTTYTVAEAQVIFEELLDRVARGDEIVLVDGKRRAKLAPYIKPTRKRRQKLKKK